MMFLGDKTIAGANNACNRIADRSYALIGANKLFGAETLFDVKLFLGVDFCLAPERCHKTLGLRTAWRQNSVCFFETASNPGATTIPAILAIPGSFQTTHNTMPLP